MQYFHKLAALKARKKLYVRFTYGRRERLRRRNQRDRDRRTAESAQQREARLAEDRDRAHRASWSGAQRERVFGHRRGRLASETPDQRTNRLELGRASVQY